MHSAVVKASALVVATTMVEGIAQNQVYLVGVLAAVVASVVGVVAWLDSRIQRAILAHTDVEMERNKLVMKEIQHLREMVEARLERNNTGEFRIHNGE